MGNAFEIKHHNYNKMAFWSNIIFFTALFIEILIVIIDKSALINPIEGRLFQVTFVLCLIKIMMTKYNVKECSLMLVFFIVGIVVDQITDQNEVIRIVAFVAAAKDINQKRALKVVFWITTIGILCLIGLSLLGVAGNIYLETDFYRETGIERRYCLGIGHPNALHCMYWSLVTLGVYVYYDVLKWWHCLIIMAVNVGLFSLTDSRTGLLATTLSLFIAATGIIFKQLKDKKLVYIIAIIVVISCVGFSIVVACFNGLYGDVYRELPPILEKLNQKMTGRIRDGGYVGAIRKWRLFSNLDKKGYLDMGFIKLFYWYGIVPAILYIVSTLLLIVDSMKKKKIETLIVVVSFSVYTIVEAHVISPYFGRNYLLMLFFGIWSEAFCVKNGIEGHFWQLKKLFGKNNV